MVHSDFIFIQNSKNWGANHGSGDLFTFNRYEELKDSNKNFDTGRLTPVEFYKLEFENSQTSYFHWGSVFLRNEYNNNDCKLLNDRDIAIIHLKEGDNFIKKCKGSFIIIICNNDNSIKILSDQLHPRSAYYSYQNDSLILSSSLSELIGYLHEKGKTVSVNYRWLIEYSLYGYALDNTTMITNIFETQPGQIVLFSNGETLIQKHFDVLCDLDYFGPKMNVKDGIEYLKFVFKNNIKLFDRGAEETAIALTGGYDSRSVIASLGENYRDYQYYSYGRPGSWDIKIPQEIARKLKLNYKAFLFEQKFDDLFVENGLKSVLLSDGTGKFSLSNYPYVYEDFFSGKTSVLTGLFGSELIKRFTGANLVMSPNMLSMLSGNSLEDTLSIQLDEIINKSIFGPDLISLYKGHVTTNLRENSIINNDLPQNQKIFIHFLAQGSRRYFQNELKIQSPWVTNLHPFYDIDFITALLNTPFPNLYNWELKKSLIKNLDSHKLYGALIDQLPALSGFMSTHGFKPKYLRSKIYSPLIALDFYHYKKRINSSSSMTFNDLINNTVSHYLSKIKIEKDSQFYPLLSEADKFSPQFLQLFSTLYWLKSNGVEV